MFRCQQTRKKMRMLKLSIRTVLKLVKTFAPAPFHSIQHCNGYTIPRHILQAGRIHVIVDQAGPHELLPFYDILRHNVNDIIPLRSITFSQIPLSVLKGHLEEISWETGAKPVCLV